MSKVVHLKGPKVNGVREKVYYATHKNYVEGLDAELDKKLDVEANAVSAAKFETARNLKVSLSSSDAQFFDGSSDATIIGVGGILPIANGGTGKTKLSEVTVGKAAQLENSRNIITNLASTVAGAFNGTASVSAGVTGTLPIANGGTGKTNLSEVTVGKATQLENSRNIITNLTSTVAGAFNGTASVSAGVTGTLPVANGGTGKTNLSEVTVGKATQLENSRNIITNLTSTVAGGFNGTASVSAGVTGTLPVTNGGTGQTDLNNVKVGTATKATQDGAGNVIADTYATKTELDSGLDKKLDVAAYVSLHNAKRYGYRISKTEADPAARVEYLYDAVGMTPAYMDFANGVFNYGSWGDVWFVKDNKPLMLKYDGTVDYYLNPNDYTKKLDGTASDVANINYGGNAMAQIPLCWVYRYEDENYYYEIVSDVQWDANYKAYAHTDASGNIKPYFYNSLFGASGSASNPRSISGQTRINELARSIAITYDNRQSAGWNANTWSMRCFITTLLVLLGKSTNTQAVFGNSCGEARLITGTLKDKGQFYGYSSTNQQVKVFHIEAFWGDQAQLIRGIYFNDNKFYVKMTPEGNGYKDRSGYIDTGIPYSFNRYDFIKAMSCSEYGMIPKEAGGSNNTYFCDAMDFYTLSYDICAGSPMAPDKGTGAFSIAESCQNGSYINRDGCTLSYV